METQELALQPSDVTLAADVERSRFMPIMAMEQALERREIIAKAFAKLMKAATDYGAIGSSKPTLLQPGAQKLDNLFGLVPRFEVIDREEDWTGESHAGEPFFRYLIRCQVMRGDFVMGEAIGECNSWESKYRYRTADRTCPSCGKSTILFTKKDNWWCNKHKGGCGAGFKKDDEKITKQETGRKSNPEIFDQVNTLQKMAQKRAHVGATINATSASEFFTQDLEDMREVERQEEGASGAGNAAGTSDANHTDSRPIPEELKAAFDRIDMKDVSVMKSACAYIEGLCVEIAGEKGLLEYKAQCAMMTKRYPDKSKCPHSALKTWLLDLWDMVAEMKKAKAQEQVPVSFVASDSDLPF